MRIILLEDTAVTPQRAAIERLKSDALLKLTLEEDRWNRIGGVAVRSPRGALIGYLPSEDAAEFRPSLMSGGELVAIVVEKGVRHGQQLMVVGVAQPGNLAVGPEAPLQAQALMDAKPAPDVYVRTYTINIVGEQHHQSAVRACRSGDRAGIYLEPDNPHDPKAIAVANSHGDTVGYIPRDSFLQRIVHEEGGGFSATVEALRTESHGGMGILLNVQLDGAAMQRRSYSGRNVPKAVHNDDDDYQPRTIPWKPLIGIIVAAVILTKMCTG